MSSRRPKVLWVTNMAPPYRIPLWEALAQLAELRIGLLESSDRLARDSGANRGDDWRLNTVPGATVHEYGTFRIQRGEERHYTLRSLEAAHDLAWADVVLLGGWDSPAYVQLLAQAKATGKATVGFYESVLASQSRTRGPVATVRRAFFRSIDRVVVPGPSSQEAIAEMGVPADRILTGFNSVDVDAFAAAPTVESEAPGHRFLFVGQFIERKNIDGILRAFASMASPDDTLTLIGRGDRKEHLELLADESGVGTRVRFVDYVANKELPTWMARHQTLILASNREVWGLVVNEALATGMQVVVTRNCGVAGSVAGMPGVYLADAGITDLAAKMADARNAWKGRISSPPILRETPARFARVFHRAFVEAIDSHHDHRDKDMAAR